MAAHQARLGEHVVVDHQDDVASGRLDAGLLRRDGAAVLDPEWAQPGLGRGALAQVLDRAVPAAVDDDDQLERGGSASSGPGPRWAAGRGGCRWP